MNTNVLVLVGAGVGTIIAATGGIVSVVLFPHIAAPIVSAAAVGGAYLGRLFVRECMSFFADDESDALATNNTPPTPSSLPTSRLSDGLMHINILSRREETMRDNSHYHRLLESSESFDVETPPRPRRPRLID